MPNELHLGLYRHLAHELADEGGQEILDLLSVGGHLFSHLSLNHLPLSARHFEARRCEPETEDHLIEGLP